MWIKLGVCGKAHGIKGGFDFRLENIEDSALAPSVEVLLKPSSRASSLDPQGETFVIEKISFGHKTMAYLKGVSDRNRVEEIIPFEIFIHRDQLPEAAENEVYLSDLVGLKVFSHADGREIGVVKKFYDNTAQAIIVIEGEEHLELPFVEQFFPVVDIEGSRIEVNIPEVVE